MCARVSVVIIAKNEAAKIETCVTNALRLTNDVIVVDAESSDNTVELARKAGAKVIVHQWVGYGQNRNIGAKNAQNDWIFSLDADERFSDELIQSIRDLALTEKKNIYNCQRLTFIGEKPILHGDWAHDAVVRLYNRTVTEWNEAEVHEHIERKDCAIVRIKGALLHYSFENTQQLFEKAKHYSLLNAQKYAGQKSKQKVAGFKMLFSPMAAFIKTYIIRAGFLDGKEGLAIANAAAFSAYTKYKLLRKIKRQRN